jgi:beta-keto acid cleavage enzyme
MSKPSLSARTRAPRELWIGWKDHPDREIEPVEVSTADAIGLVEDINRALDSLDLAIPRLQHGDREATWVLLTDAIRRGLDTRIGLEDTLYEPNGERTSSNEALVRSACELDAGKADCTFEFSLRGVLAVRAC